MDIFYQIYSFSTERKHLHEYIQYLSKSELKVLHEFAFPSLRERYALCRGTLRKVLSAYLSCHPKEIQFTYNEYGKPLLQNKSFKSFNVHFNVSHSGDLFKIALSKLSAVGVDIEQMNQKIDVIGVGKEVFTSNELSKLVQYTEKEKYFEFYRMWTIKEAYIKYLGRGFSFDPKKIEVCEKNFTFQYPGSPQINLSHPKFSQYFLDSKYSVAIVYSQNSEDLSKEFRGLESNF